MLNQTLPECAHCGDTILDGYDNVKDGEIYCDDCYNDKFFEHCPICENSYEKVTKPEDTFFYLHMELDGLKPGYYSVKRFPVYISDYFSIMINTYNVELASDNICYKSDGPLEQTDFICQDCFNQKGLEGHRVVNHIRYETSKMYDQLEQKKYTSIDITVSREYYNSIEGKLIYDNWNVIEDDTKATQELTILIHK